MAPASITTTIAPATVFSVQLHTRKTFFFLLFVASRQHSQSRENINFPEDEIVGASEGQTGDSGPGKTAAVQTLFSFSCKKNPATLFLICDGAFLPAPTLVLPRASSPLTISPKSATPTPSQAPPSGDDDQHVNVTITVEATGP